MNPEFAKVVDPIFEATLRLESRIENGERIVTADERATLIRKIEEAEAKLGRSEEWILSKYALCAWIDSQLIEIDWREKDWWKDNCLESKFFGTRDAHEEFFKRAEMASALSTKNALEVFYIAVVLGFRGFYGNSDASYARKMSSMLRIPDNVEGWCRDTVRALHLRQGRPEIPGEIQVGMSAKPLRGKRMLMMCSMSSLIFLALAFGTYLFLHL